MQYLKNISKIINKNLIKKSDKIDLKIKLNNILYKLPNSF